MIRSLCEACAGAIAVPAHVKLGEMSVKDIRGGLGKGGIAKDV